MGGAARGQGHSTITVFAKTWIDRMALNIPAVTYHSGIRNGFDRLNNTCPKRSPYLVPVEDCVTERTSFINEPLARRRGQFSS
jgi:hypothetical protein